MSDEVVFMRATQTGPAPTPRATVEGDFSRIHMASSGTATGFLGSNTGTLTGFTEVTDYTFGALITGNDSGATMLQAGIYAVTAVFSVNSNTSECSGTLADHYDTAVGQLHIGDPNLGPYDLYESVAAALDTSNRHYGEFTISWTGYVTSGTTVTVKGSLQDVDLFHYGNWDFLYGDLWVQRLAPADDISSGS